MAIGKIFGFGATKLSFSSQKNNYVENDTDTNPLINKYGIPLPQQTDDKDAGSVYIKYGIPLPQDIDNFSKDDKNEPVKTLVNILKYRIIQPPLPKYAIPSSEADNNNDNYDGSPLMKYGIPQK